MPCQYHLPDEEEPGYVRLCKRWGFYEIEGKYGGDKFCWQHQRILESRRS